MKVFQRKKKRIAWWYAFPALVLLFLAVLGLGRAAWSAFLKEQESGKQRSEAEDKLSSLEERRAALEQRIAALKTAAGVETEIREQFQVTKPLERMVVVVPEKKTAEAPVEPTRSFIARFFDIFR